MIATKMAGSNLVYLTGGLASVLIERLRKVGVDRLLQDYDGVVIGRSAGALALCRKCIITCHRSDPKAKIINGLNLVDLTLKVHYKPENNKALETLSEEAKIYAIPMGSALVYDNGACSPIGAVYLFENGKTRML
jgi:peptidase E